MVVGWLDIDDVRDRWPDAVQMDDDELGDYLAAAYAACVAYLPPSADVEADNASWRLAQLMQARATWRALRAGTGDNIGSDGLTVTVFPLDWQVRQLLRPRRIGRVL